MAFNLKLNALANWLERRATLAQPWRQLRYVALDLETTGLDAQQDSLLAMAWLNIQPPLMDYGSAQYHVMGRKGRDLKRDLKQSPVIHGLLERDFLRSSEPQQTLRVLSRVLNDAVLVCHHVSLDWQFLQAAAKRYNVTLKPLAFFDTLQFERRRMQQQNEQPKPGELTLSACRAKYNLPMYGNHHAFSDALGCGELFLAQVYQYCGNEPIKARKIVQTKW
ncbi:DNA polymerase-3 subunit epsilon [Pseudidiomarina planktonica]|uniref:DNA polymerase-3 subunit epsilon n=1 Tax=Pseudidiomarina planktonica TaxID=1323738 RepID=A0A1Y6EH55_9GAMM|nr:3'-5' exonuclease [Pseudidiomarina planktonica]RUO65900.1 3'-5' exonuclease [Pseudidiomarina planktonica]SMQ61944.1 DNA polymerase-3 subunit epsilon [Pseudidiomarina planktonica]